MRGGRTAAFHRDATASNIEVANGGSNASANGGWEKGDGRAATDAPIRHLDMALLCGGPRSRRRVERMVQNYVLDRMHALRNGMDLNV